MTTTAKPTGAATETTADPGSPRTPRTPRLLSRLRIRRGQVVFGTVILMLLIALIAAASLLPRSNQQPLDPDGAGPTGARAVAQVLGRQGLTVTVVRTEARLRALDLTGATVVVTRPELLSADTLAAVRADAAPALRLVVVDPDTAAVRGLSIPANAEAISDTDSIAAGDGGCGIVWLRGLSISGAQTAYSVDGAGAPCFDGAIWAVPPISGVRPQVVLIGSSAVLQNATITSADNAAVALRILGARSSVVWFAPTTQTADNPATTGPAWPTWLPPMVWLAGLVVILLVFWRGRRFGALAREPLPVVVRANETTVSRGLLYRRAGDTKRSGRILRDATCRRLSAYFGLPPGAPPAALTTEVATAAGMDRRAVHGVLFGTDSADEAALVALATNLQDLERKVRR
ncbi:DUF4350 domain-containing protein [Rudaeicoccus suwonensis]|uniref:Uncharacterized protein DUF4350 n=1 Tax=Rudaeicoccus suwonensis TaxID=657409 RepID=A0A561E8W0_9MICO|nr:DUF4350 domain-containing protein [Rudaeicoccus suwonensis]TWE12052.1 uncharacterized protein DUF4350 [Rudaeicoccus suwonensis]